MLCGTCGILVMFGGRARYHTHNVFAEVLSMENVIEEAGPQTKAGTRIILPTDQMVRTKSASGSTSFHCGDPVAKALDGVSLDLVKELAVAAGIEINKYEHLNPGQQRMTLGNVMRNLLRREQIDPAAFQQAADGIRAKAEQEIAARQAAEAEGKAAKEAEKAAKAEEAKAIREAEKAAKAEEAKAAKEAAKAAKEAEKAAKAEEKAKAKAAAEAAKAEEKEKARIAREEAKKAKDAEKARKAEEAKAAKEAAKAAKEAAEHPHAGLVEDAE